MAKTPSLPERTKAIQEEIDELIDQRGQGGSVMHGGMLGAISEAREIAEQTGCSVGEAFAKQRERADTRLVERHRPHTAEIIQFRPRAAR
jgi:hypothetical protein